MGNYEGTKRARTRVTAGVHKQDQYDFFHVNWFPNQWGGDERFK